MNSVSCAGGLLFVLACSIKVKYSPPQFEGEGRSMLAGDLDHKELLELDPEGGVIRFAEQRALLIDAVAMGLLRRYLIENGIAAARAVLTQFDFDHCRLVTSKTASRPFDTRRA